MPRPCLCDVKEHHWDRSTWSIIPKDPTFVQILSALYQKPCDTE